MRTKLTLAICVLSVGLLSAPASGSGSAESVAGPSAPPTDSLSTPSGPSAPGDLTLPPGDDWTPYPDGAPQGDLDPDGGWAAYPGGDITPFAQSGDITAGACKYRQVIDNAHVSSTPPRATSVHGSWNKISGRCPARANVDTGLQAYYCIRVQGSYSCRWIEVDFNSANVRPGGGAGKRVTARETCSNSNRIGWRGRVDVDLIGVRDPAGFTYSPPQNLKCAPSSFG